MTSELEKLAALRIRPEVPEGFIEAVCGHIRSGMSLAKIAAEEGDALARRFPEMGRVTANDLYRLKRTNPTFAMAYYESRADQVERRFDDLYHEIDDMEGTPEENRRLSLKLKLVSSEAKAMLPKLFGDGKSPVGPDEMAQAVAKEMRKALPFAAVPMKAPLPAHLDSQHEAGARPMPRVVETQDEGDDADHD